MTQQHVTCGHGHAINIQMLCMNNINSPTFRNSTALLLPSTALQHTLRIITVDMQLVLILYSLVEVVLSV